MKKGQAHPAALTSKKMISAALLELLQEKEYKHITITEVCSRSQIARRTFYRNFETIDDVLIFLVKNIIDDFTAEMKVHSQDCFQEILIAYFTFWNAHFDMLTLLNQNGLTHIIFIEYIKSLAELPFLSRINPSVTMNAEEFPFILAFTAGGLWSVLTFYISHQSRQSPEQLAEIITRQLKLKDPGN